MGIRARSPAASLPVTITRSLVVPIYKTRHSSSTCPAHSTSSFLRHPHNPSFSCDLTMSSAVSSTLSPYLDTSFWSPTQERLWSCPECSAVLRPRVVKTEGDDYFGMRIIKVC